MLGNLDLVLSKSENIKTLDPVNSELGNTDPTEDGLLLGLSLGPTSDGALIKLENLGPVSSRPETLEPNGEELLITLKGLDPVLPGLKARSPEKEGLLVRLENVFAKDVLHDGGINGAPVLPVIV